MQFSRRTAQLLHDDHRATLAVIESLENLLARVGRRPPDVNDQRTANVLSQIADAIAHEVRDHFRFEEEELFTRLADLGDGDIGEHLRQEHQAILPLGEHVADRAKQALENGFTDETWPPFKTEAGELIERMLAHIQKEEMALLPMVEDLLDAETDMKLYEEYSADM